MGDALKDFVYDTARTSSVDQLRVRCPACSPNRKLIHRNERTLSITVSGDKATFYCHHCPAKGAISMKGGPSPVPIQRIQAAVQPAPMARKIETTELSEAGTRFLNSRGLSAAVAAGAGVKTAKVYFRELGGEAEAVAFPYTNAGKPYAFKFRSIEGKEFSCNGAPSSFFNVDAHSGDTLIIVEGEFDVLAIGETGNTAVSVPGGAPGKPLRNTHIEDLQSGKLAFLWTHRELLKAVKRVLIAVDMDEPGRLLAEELARRIGKEKCFFVSFPDGCKDANDTLLKVGADGLQRCLDEAVPVPVAGLHSANEFQSHVADLYENGLKGGESTGWPGVDKIVTVQQGMLYVVTGIPGSGKSSWIDAMTVNLAKNNGWRTIMASFENPIPIHIAKLCSAYTGYPFSDKYNNRMGPEEVTKAHEWVNEHFMFMSNDVEMPTVQSILDRAKIGILRSGAKVVVMDPANFLQHKDGEEANEQVDAALVQFKNFAMANDVAFFLVAHPKKPGDQKSNQWYPQGYSIAGTAGFYNRSDVGITIHRTPDDFTRVIVWKARFNHIATNGEASLSYDTSTGKFTESRLRPQRPQSEDLIDDF